MLLIFCEWVTLFHDISYCWAMKRILCSESQGPFFSPDSRDNRAHWELHPHLLLKAEKQGAKVITQAHWQLERMWMLSFVAVAHLVWLLFFCSVAFCLHLRGCALGMCLQVSIIRVYLKIPCGPNSAKWRNIAIVFCLHPSSVWPVTKMSST